MTRGTSGRLGTASGAGANVASVCVDGRNLALRHGTGVTTYAATLAAGLPRIGRDVEVLLDADPDAARRRPTALDPATLAPTALDPATLAPTALDPAALGSRARGRAGRWLRAAWPGGVLARPVEPPPGFAGAWLARDVFRLAQVHFDLHGRLLAVRSHQTGGMRAPGLMHWTYPLPVVFKGAANIYTVHDLIPLRKPKLTDIDSARFARLIRQVVRQADHIITVSETSRRDIQALLGVPEARVTNTYQPASLPDGLRRAPPPVRQGHFLFCGSIEPRKNLGRLLAAHRASGSAAPLILAGPDGWRAREELAAGGVEVRGLEALTPATRGGAWRAPWLPRPALLDLLRGARALLFPSLAEGFGLPIVEAMSLGVPVLTAAGGATGEIAGDAAVLVDPYDVAAMADAIAALDRDPALCQRLAAAGLRRSAVFSAEACLGRLAVAYASVGAARA